MHVLRALVTRAGRDRERALVADEARLDLGDPLLARAMVVRNGEERLAGHR